MPDNEQDTGCHQDGVDRLQAALEADHTQVGFGKPLGQVGNTLHRRHGPTEKAQHANTRELFLDRRGELGVRLSRPRRPPSHPAAGGMRQDHGQGRWQQRHQREAGVIHQHCDDERKGEEDGVPHLNRELTDADAKHLDIADDSGHQVSERRPLEVSHRPSQHTAKGVSPDVRADPGIGGHQPPPFSDARNLGK